VENQSKIVLKVTNLILHCINFIILLYMDKLRIIITVLLLIAITQIASAQFKDILDEKNGFQDITLGSDVKEYPGLGFKKKLVEDDLITELYSSKNGHYKDVGGIKIFDLSVKTYKSKILQINVIADKDPNFYKGLEKKYGEGEYSIKRNSYVWRGKKLSLTFRSIKKNKVELIYFSYLIRDFIKADKIKAIEDIADDF